MDWAAGFWKRAEEVSLQASPSRDRVIDLLRAGSLVVVVVGHVLMAVVVWRHDTPRVGNLLAEIPSLKIARPGRSR